MAKDKIGRKINRCCRRFDRQLCKKIKKAVRWGKVMLLLFTGIFYSLGMGLLLYEQRRDKPQKATLFS